MRVAVERLVSCGRCELCETGRDNICRDVQLLGVHRPGGLAEHVVVPSQRVFALPEGLPPELASLTEPLAVSVHGLRRGGFAPGASVLVLGAGTIGLTTILSALGMGAGRVWASARYPHQAALARALGAERVLSEDEAAPAALDQLSREHEFDVVVETVGGEANTLQAACHALRPGGVVSVLGIFMGRVEIDPLPLLLREGGLLWSNCSERRGDAADFVTAIELMDRERERLARLATHTLSLAEVDRAFALAADKQAGTIKVSLSP